MKRERFSGPLELEEVYRGAVLAGENAERLLKDAGVVLKRGSAQSALALAIMGMEEEAKCASLVLMADLLERDETPDWASFWKGFYSHDAKHLLGSHVNLLATADRDEDGLTIYGLLNEADLEHWRQASLYLDRDKEDWNPPPAETPDVVVAIIAAGALHLPLLLWRARREMDGHFTGAKRGDPSKEEWTMHQRALQLFEDIQLVGLRPERSVVDECGPSQRHATVSSTSPPTRSQGPASSSRPGRKARGNG